MLRDEDRIFTNLYGQQDFRLAAAQKRGVWSEMKTIAALGHERRSLPSLLMVHADLAAALEAFRSAPPVADYLDRLAELRRQNAV